MKTGDLVVKQIEFLREEKRNYLRRWREDRKNDKKRNKRGDSTGIHRVHRKAIKSARPVRGKRPGEHFGSAINSIQQRHAGRSTAPNLRSANFGIAQTLCEMSTALEL